jgi:hypothetical protein
MVVVSDDGIFHIVYVSAALAPMNEAALKALLERSRLRYAASHITGMLLYHEGSFFQVLEGPQAAVEETFARIERDPRHRQVAVLLRGHVQQRSFGDWRMAFFSCSPEEARALEGFSAFFLGEEGPAGGNDARRTALFMERFRSGAWRPLLRGE